MIKSDAAFRCIPDAGFFFNSADFSGKKGRWSVKWEDMTKLHDSMAIMNSQCLSNMPSDYKWTCLLADHALKYINTSTFLIQSAMDLWQLEYNYFSTDLTQAATQAGH